MPCSCGRPNDPNANFCDRCGKKLIEFAEEKKRVDSESFSLLIAVVALVVALGSFYQEAFPGKVLESAVALIIAVGVTIITVLMVFFVIKHYNR